MTVSILIGFLIFIMLFGILIYLVLKREKELIYSCKRKNEIQNKNIEYNIVPVFSGKNNNGNVNIQTQENNLKRLNDIKNICSITNWNSYDALPISESIIKQVEAMLNLFKIQPSISPTGRNSIQLEWLLNNEYFELEVFEDNIKFYTEKEEV